MSRKSEAPALARDGLYTLRSHSASSNAFIRSLSPEDYAAEAHEWPKTRAIRGLEYTNFTVKLGGVLFG
ncbi:hypothetical protein KIMH_09080 [Bombiscardovia apis]|uniref:Uncharacterized protein n=1 Tax=Bombiscardovia apis TaxID=2932182 RepID=A0ABM8BD27_9BIFI|nr:hypothetical protein KIMH_09080 [Bombiscardovia apis]